MKIINGTSKIIYLPLGGSMMTILPKNVSSEVVASRNLVMAAITTGTNRQIGLVTYSAAELQVINGVTGAQPFLHDSLEDAISKLIPEGVKPVVETRIIDGGEVTLASSETSDPTKTSPDTSPDEHIGRLSELQEENEKLKSEHKGLTEKNKHLEGQIKTLQDELRLLKDSTKGTTDSDSKVSELQETINNLEKKLEDEMQSNVDLTKELSSAKDLVVQKNAKIDELSSSSTEEIKKLKETIKELNEPKDIDIESFDEYKELEEANKALTEEIEKLKEASSTPGVSAEELEAAKRETEKFKSLLSDTVSKNNLKWDSASKSYIPAE